MEHPYLSSMKEITSTVHKYFKFPHNGEVITINHSMYQPRIRKGDVCLGYFWFE